jgi:hypothetical protein
MSIKISEIEEIFNEVFEEEKGLVNSVDTVYETPEEDSDFIKLLSSFSLTKFAVHKLIRSIWLSKVNLLF